MLRSVTESAACGELKGSSRRPSSSLEEGIKCNHAYLQVVDGLEDA